MMITHRTWTKKELKERIKEAATTGVPIPAARILCETSMFGPEMRPNSEPAVCLNHPKRTTFAQVKIDGNGNIVGVK